MSAEVAAEHRQSRLRKFIQFPLTRLVIALLLVVGVVQGVQSVLNLLGGNLSGGSYGIETSIVTFIFVLLAGLYLLWKARAKGHFIPPFWRVAPDDSLQPAEGE